jgi:hypothetical protein
MRTLRYLFATSLLASALYMSALAGTIHTGSPEPEPTPAPAEGEMSTPLNGDMHTTNSDEATADEVVAAGALGLLQGVLSLL